MQHIDELGSAGEQGSGGCAHILPPAEVYHEHVAVPGEQWGGARPLRQPRSVGPPHITETLQAAQVNGLFDIPLYSSETRNVVHMSVTLSLPLGRGQVPLGRPQLRGGERGRGAGRLYSLHRALERSNRSLVSWNAGICTFSLFQFSMRSSL